MKCESCGRNMSPDEEVCPYCGGKPDSKYIRSSKKRPATVDGKEYHFSIKRLVFLLISGFIGLAALAVGLYFGIMLPRSNYQLAVGSLEKGEWQEAAKIFVDCRYKDSRSLYYYCAGMYRFEQGAWADAAEYFAKSEKPAPDGVYPYCQAMDAMDKGQWSDAAQLFSLTGGYGNSEEMMAVCLALEAHFRGDTEKAASLLPGGEEYSELFNALSYSSYYDLVFIEKLSESLEAGFAFARENEGAEIINASNALDCVYYAFYDVYTSNKEDFSSLFRDKKLAALAEKYITDSLRQWSLTSYDGSILPEYCEEYFSLAAQRRRTAAEIDRMYHLDADRSAFEEFVACSGDLSRFSEEYLTPLEELIETALKKPERIDGAYWLSFSHTHDDEEQELEDDEIIFSLKLDFYDRIGSLISSLGCEQLHLASGDSLLICLEGYTAAVSSTRITLTPLQLYVGEKAILGAMALI